MKTMLPKATSVWAKEKMDKARELGNYPDYEAYEALYKLWKGREDE